jgi:hypothetical protein
MMVVIKNVADRGIMCLQISYIVVDFPQGYKSSVHDGQGISKNI